MTTKTENSRSLYVAGVFLVISGFMAAPAVADLVSAGKAYTSGNFDAAFKDYRALAELGQPTAQFNVATMYARGGVPGRAISTRMPGRPWPPKTGWKRPRSWQIRFARRFLSLRAREQIAADIEAQYGHAVLDQRLLPRIVEEGADSSDRARCFPRHVSMPSYPERARMAGIQGQVYVEYSVWPDGRSRNPRVVFAVPQDMFDSAARDGVLHTEFSPGSPADKPVVQCTMFFRFEMQGMTKEDYPGLQRFVQQTLTKAQAGDPHAQMLYGMLLMGLPQLNKPRSEALPWFLKSAQAGTPVAQFQIGYGLLKGWGCDCEDNKGLEWLRRAAQAGQADAEVTLAMFALRGNPDEDRQKQARLWLEQAAASDSHDGKVYLAALLAAGQADQTRDPKRALLLVDEVFHGVKDDPAAFEIRAAAQASSGDFKSAVTSQNKAVSMAERLHWDVTPFNERLAHYTASQPWYGTLLDF